MAVYVVRCSEMMVNNHIFVVIPIEMMGANENWGCSFHCYNGD